MPWGPNCREHHLDNFQIGVFHLFPQHLGKGMERCLCGIVKRIHGPWRIDQAGGHIDDRGIPVGHKDGVQTVHQSDRGQKVDGHFPFRHIRYAQGPEERGLVDDGRIVDQYVQVQVMFLDMVGEPGTPFPIGKVALECMDAGIRFFGLRQFFRGASTNNDIVFSFEKLSAQFESYPRASPGDQDGISRKFHIGAQMLILAQR